MAIRMELCVITNICDGKGRDGHSDCRRSADEQKEIHDTMENIKLLLPIIHLLVIYIRLYRIQRQIQVSNCF